MSDHADKEWEEISLWSLDAKKIYKRFVDANFGKDGTPDGIRNKDVKIEYRQQKYVHCFMAGLMNGQERYSTHCKELREDLKEYCWCIGYASEPCTVCKLLHKIPKDYE